MNIKIYKDNILSLDWFGILSIVIPLLFFAIELNILNFGEVVPTFFKLIIFIIILIVSMGFMADFFHHSIFEFILSLLIYICIENISYIGNISSEIKFLLIIIFLWLSYSSFKDFSIFMTFTFFFLVNSTYLREVKRYDTIQIISNFQKIIDGEVSYFHVHNNFYVNSDIKRTLEVLNINNIDLEKYDIGIKSGETTLLLRANEKGKMDYIYMFYPKENSDKVKGYNTETWSENIYNKGYIEGYKPKVDIDLQNDGEVVSTY